MIVYAVGIGPGNAEHITPCAKQAICQSDVIVGYAGYIDLIRGFVDGKELISTGMTGEIERCKAAIAEAQKGKNVCVVSSGDAGIYGMASLLYELSERVGCIDIEVIPGITAASSAGALLGAPLTNDFAVISLSDLLTPSDVIEKRLDACSAADMVLCLYNPQSGARKGYLMNACNIILRHKPEDTMCGYVRNAYREKGFISRVCTLRELSLADVDMFTTVIVGNSCTHVINGKLVTSRGYSI